MKKTRAKPKRKTSNGMPLQLVGAPAAPTMASPDMVPKKHYLALETVLEMTKKAHQTEVRLLQAENATLRKMLAERGVALMHTGDAVG